MSQIHPVMGERRQWLFTCQGCRREENSRRPGKLTAVSVMRQQGWRQTDRMWFCPQCIALRQPEEGAS